MACSRLDILRTLYKNGVLSSQNTSQKELKKTLNEEELNTLVYGKSVLSSHRSIINELLDVIPNKKINDLEKQELVQSTINKLIEIREKKIVDAYGKQKPPEEYTIKPPEFAPNKVKEKQIERSTKKAAQNILDNSITIGTSLAVDKRTKLSDFVEVSSKKLGVLFENSITLKDYLDSKVGKRLSSNFNEADKNLKDFTIKVINRFNDFVHGTENTTPILDFMNGDSEDVDTRKRVNAAITGLVSLRDKSKERTGMYQYLASFDNGKYIIDPMVIEATGIAVTDWLSTQASSTFVNYKSDINRILGRNTEERVTSEEYAVFSESGVVQAKLIDTLGNKIFNSLGFKDKKSNVDGKLAPRLKVALGELAVAYMIDYKLLEQNFIDNKHFPADATIQTESSKNPNELGTMFVKVVNKEQIEDLTKLTKNSEVLPSLLTIDSYKSYPSHKPTDSVPKFLKGTRQLVPEKILNNITKLQHDEWGINNEVSNILFSFNREFVEELAGVNNDVESEHITQRNGIEGKNRRIRQSLDNFLDFKNRLKKPDQSFFMKYFASMSTRLFIDNNTINPIADKTIRHLINLKNNKIEVDTPKLRMHFKLAVAQAFGHKIDNIPLQESLDFFDEIHSKFSSVAKSLGSKDFSEDTMFSVKEAIKFGGENLHTFEGLVALSKYRENESFTTTIGVETDAKTSGVAIGQLVSILGVRPSDFAATGVFLDGVTENYTDWVKNPINKDLYEKLAETWNRILVNITKEGANQLKIAKATRSIIGSFIDEKGLISEIGRKFSKSPLMVTNYGAALSRAKKEFAYTVLDKFYHKIAHTPNDELYKLHSSLESILGVKLVQGRNLDLEFKLTNEEEILFVERIEAVHGKALEQALKERLGKFVDYQKAVNKSFQIMFRIFEAKFKIEYKKLTDEKGRAPSIEETEQLIDSLREYMPIVKGVLSKGLDDGILAIKGGLRRQYGKVNQVQTDFIRPLRNSSRRASSITSYINDYSFLDPSVSGMVTTIHNMDSAINQAVLGTFTALGIHDAAVYSLNDVESGTNTYNNAFIDTALNYDPLSEVLDSLENVIFKVKNLDRKEQVEIASNLKKIKGSYENNKYVAFSLKDSVYEIKALKAQVSGQKELFKKTYPNVSISHSIYPTTDSVAAVNIGSIPKEESLSNLAENVLKELKSYKGSNKKSIDFENFNALFSDKIDSNTIKNIFIKLRTIGKKKENKEHTETLNELLDNFIKIQDQIDIKVSEGGDTTIGAQRTLDNGSQDIHILGSLTGIRNNVEMSSQEVYVHELIHAVTEYSIDTDASLRRGLKKLFAVAEKNIKWRDFLPEGKDFTVEEVKTAKETYNYIFNNKNTETVTDKDPITGRSVKRKVNPYLHEFVAYGLSNERFAAKLSKLTVKDTDKRKATSLLDQLKLWYESAIGYIANRFRGINNLTVDKALRRLLDQTLSASEKRKYSLLKVFDLLESANTGAITALNNFIFSPVNDYRLKSKGATSIVGRTAHTLSGLLNLEVYKELGVMLKQISRNISLTERSFLVKLVREIQQQKDNNAVWHSLIRISNKAVDQARLHEHDNVIAQIREGFHKEEITKEESEALYKVFLKLDLVSLNDKEGYSPDKLIEILKDSKLLQSFIDNVEKEIASLYGSNANYYISQAEGLGAKMATGATVDMQLDNAYSIASLIANKDASSVGDLNKAEQLIDELSSLYGIKYSKVEHRDIAAAVYEEENNADTLENGITRLFYLHDFNKKESLKRLFNGQKHLIKKGYTKENFDPKIDVKVVTKKEAEVLLTEGYYYANPDKKPMTLDKDDPVGNRYLMINDHGAPSSYVKSIVSLTSKKQQGTNIEDIYSAIEPDTNYSKVKNRVKDIKKTKLTSVKNSFSKRKKPTLDSKLQPVISGNGEIVSFRYLINEHNKDKLLSRDNRFDYALGRMYGSVEDKTASTIINEKVIIEAKKEFDKNKSKELAEYVEISENSTDPELYEMYQLMPKEMKDKIEQVWGKGNPMYVREEFVNLIFGFRKIRLTDAQFTGHGVKRPSDLVQQAKGLTGASLRSMNEGLTWVLGNTLFPKAPNVDIGNLWTEVVKIAKENIVVKTGVILLPNFISNSLLLFVKGVNPVDIIKYKSEALLELNNYQKDLTIRDQLKRELKANKKLGVSKRNRMEVQLSRLNDSLDNNPIRDLIDEGIFQSIIEDVNVEEDIYSSRAKLSNRASELANKYLPEFVETGYKYLYMDRSTKPYQLLLKATQVSDFMARYALYRHRTLSAPKKFDSKKDKLNSKQEIIKEVVETFINYDVPTSAELQYINDVGGIMFTKFFFRKFKVIFNILAKRPASEVSVLLMEEVMGDLDTIEDNPFNIFTRMNFYDDVLEEAGQLPALSYVM